MHKASDFAVCCLQLDTHLFRLTNGIECGTATDANTSCVLFAVTVRMLVICLIVVVYRQVHQSEFTLLVWQPSACTNFMLKVEFDFVQLLRCLSGEAVPGAFTVLHHKRVLQHCFAG